MNTQLLIDSVVQQTVVFIAQLATAGGVRAPLAHLANQVFQNLTRELQNQGVSKKVIADMFGMGLRTYHRRVKELGESRTDSGHTLWEAVLGYLRDHEPVSASELHRRFRGDDSEVLSGVLNDLVNLGLAYRTGRGESAVYRVASESDFAGVQNDGRHEAHRYLVWLTVYRHGPLDLSEIVAAVQLEVATCQEALNQLVTEGRIGEVKRLDRTLYEADQLVIPLGTTQGWEIAVLDHFKAVVSAITKKLSLGDARSAAKDITGGSTWSIDVWEGHPLEAEALGMLARVRAMTEDLRTRVDSHNAASSYRGLVKRVVFYAGQYLRDEDRNDPS